MEIVTVSVHILCEGLQMFTCIFLTAFVYFVGFNLFSNVMVPVQDFRGKLVTFMCFINVCAMYFISLR